MKYLIPILFLLIALPALAINLLRTDATFHWTQEGEVQPEGWVVWVSRNGGDIANEQTVTEKMATIAGDPDETIEVTVQAFVGDTYSEMSVPSDPITFRVLSAPGGPALHCPGGLKEIAPGWWSLANC
jgi:hypothetical protein